jgi:hypothetical protein
MPKQFPPAYAPLAERALAQIAAEYRDFLLRIVASAEAMPDRHHIKTPADVIGLGVEEFSKRLHKRAKIKRKAAWAVEDLLIELGFKGEEGASV